MKMRKAMTQELAAWLKLVPGGDEHADNVAEAWVIEDYSTDCPGYQGPIGYILWSGSPAWHHIFTYSRHPVDGWEMCVDTVAISEGDPRGKFETLTTALDMVEQTDLVGIFDNNQDELTELLETGSVELEMLGRKWQFTLNIKEAV